MLRFAIYNDDPGAGQCSRCQETFSVSLHPLEDVANRLREAFEKHIREKHPELVNENASQKATVQ
jgi:hypothetical protein